jgi:hypothetical protein
MGTGEIEPTHQAVVELDPDDDTDAGLGDDGDDGGGASVRWVGLLIAGGVGALALLAVGAIVIVPSGQSIDGSAITSPVAGAAVPKDAAVFRWAPEMTDAIYTFTATSSDGKVLYEERNLAEPTVTVPPAALVHVDTVQWQVRVALPSGRSFDSPSFQTAVTGATER